MLVYQSATNRGDVIVQRINFFYVKLHLSFEEKVRYINIVPIKNTISTSKSFNSNVYDVLNNVF